MAVVQPDYTRTICTYFCARTRTRKAVNRKVIRGPNARHTCDMSIKAVDRFTRSPCPAYACGVCRTCRGIVTQINCVSLSLTLNKSTVIGVAFRSREWTEPECGCGRLWLVPGGPIEHDWRQQNRQHLAARSVVSLSTQVMC